MSQRPRFDLRPDCSLSNSIEEGGRAVHHAGCGHVPPILPPSKLGRAIPDPPPLATALALLIVIAPLIALVIIMLVAR